MKCSDSTNGFEEAAELEARYSKRPTTLLNKTFQWSNLGVKESLLTQIGSAYYVGGNKSTLNRYLLFQGLGKVRCETIEPTVLSVLVSFCFVGLCLRRGLINSLHPRKRLTKSGIRGIPNCATCHFIVCNSSDMLLGYVRSD